jgi:hypothetical protein
MPGVIKLKMLHRRGATVLLPEVIVLGGTDPVWVQPHFFYAPSLAFGDGDATASLRLGALDPNRAKPGLDLSVTFAKSDKCGSFADSSETYRCVVESEYSPNELATGEARVRSDGGLDLQLYHHTASGTLPVIQDSQQVRGSEWNYQGTRKLENVHYAYFTSLRRIESEGDLRALAMASSGQLDFRLDTNHRAAPDLVIPVYRASTHDRDATLTLWVPAEAVSTPHVWQHIGPPVHYELAHPWIHRVGVPPGGHVAFADGRAIFDPNVLKRFDYAVIGDCTTVDGLRAPFDEEATTSTFHIQDLGGTDAFEFWYQHQNSSLHRLPDDPFRFVQ